MRLKDLLKNLDGETEIIIKHELRELDKSQIWYEGLADDIPHTLVDYKANYSDSITINDDGKLEITLGKPERRKANLTNGEWLDSMVEEEKLLMIIALLYNYDSGTVYYEQENFDNDNEWPEVREKALNFFEKRYGVIANRKGYLDWINRLSANRKTD